MNERYADFKTLEITQEGRLLRVMLNQPESLNAVGGELQEDLIALWPVIRRDDSVGCVLLTAAGRAFSAGGDIKGMAERAADRDRNGALVVGGLLQRAKILLAG